MSDINWAELRNDENQANEYVYQANKLAGIVAANTDVRALTSASNQFAFRLLGILRDEYPRDNIFFSPLSIAQALSLAMNGAGGLTQEEIRKTLGFDDLTIGQANMANESILQTLGDVDPGVSVAVANGIWVDKQATLNQDFTTRCQSHYAAKVSSLDFQSPSAVSEINDWVADRTQNAIRDIVGPNHLQLGSVVLINTVYFKGDWSVPFDEEFTRDGNFTRDDGAILTLPMMAQDDSLRYFESSDLQAVSLPYGCRRLRLDVLIPKPDRTIDFVCRGLDSSRFTGYISEMVTRDVSLLLPRFTVEYSEDFSGRLESIGMISSFSAGADFKPMGLPQGFIGGIIHKAVLEVNELGTMAAAATETAVAAGLPREPQVTVCVDRPFFCALCDSKTGTILFMGIIRDPHGIGTGRT